MMEFVNGKDDIPYMNWKIKFMFETTNQIAYSVTIPKTPGFTFLRQVSLSYAPRFGKTSGNELGYIRLEARCWNCNPNDL